MSKFKIGEKVKCVDISNMSMDADLKKGKIYTVCCYGEDSVRVKELHEFTFFDYRFKRYSKELVNKFLKAVK